MEGTGMPLQNRVKQGKIEKKKLILKAAHVGVSVPGWKGPVCLRNNVKQCQS
jgi:hypothetical protein